MRHTNVNKEYFTFTTRKSTQIYTMRVSHNNHTAIFDQQGKPLAEGGFKCVLWLLRNRPAEVSLWNGNQLEGTLCFA